MPLGEKVGALAREWRVLLALLALASFALLIPLYPTPGRRLAKDADEIKLIRRLIDRRQTQEAERRAQVFLLERGGTLYGPEARYLLGLAVLADARGRAVPGLESVDRAWRELRTARTEGYDAGQCAARLVECANLLRDHGLYREAAEKYRALIDEDGRREVTLELATCYALEALAVPDESDSLVREALARVDDYLLGAGPDDAVAAHLVRARIFWRHRRFPEMERTTADALTRYPNSSLDAALRLEHGKALSRLKKPDSAFNELLKARTTETDPARRDEAAYFEAEIRIARLDLGGATLARDLVAIRSRFGPLATILLGRYYLDSRREDPYPIIRDGLTALKDAGELESNNITLDDLYSRLMAEWKAKPDLETLRTADEILKQFQRLYPRKFEYVFDAAALQQLGGEKIMEVIRQRDPAETGPLRKQASNFFWKSAQGYEQAAALPEATKESQAANILEAARVYFAGGWYAKSATRYRLHYEMTGDPSSLYNSALSLKEAKIYQTKFTHEPDALGTFSEFIHIAGPKDDLVPDAILQQGLVFMELGRYPESIAGFELLLGDFQYNLSPRDPRWAQALLLKGRAHLEMARRAGTDVDLRRRSLAEAKRALAEYLERYADELPQGERPRAGTITAAFALGRATMEERDWPEAAKAFQHVFDLASVIPSAARESQSTEVKLAHFLLADVFFNQERFDEAFRAYELAYRKYSASEERLWGLLGQARALKRLDRLEEANRLHAQAISVYQENRELFDNSLDGFGRQYWPERLKDW